MDEKIIKTIADLSSRNEDLLEQYAASNTAHGDILNQIKENEIKIKNLQGMIENKPAEASISDQNTYDSKKSNNDVDLFKTLDLFKNAGKNLNYQSTIEDWKEVDKIKSLLYNEIFGELVHKVKFDPTATAKFSYVLADKIYQSEEITQEIKNDIIIIRDTSGGNRWQDRSIIVSAISLSLIQSKKFDPQKADTLLDFISDFEENVWQRALTGLVLSLLANINKWQKYEGLRKRLSRLQEIENVQDALSSIEYLLRNCFYKQNFFDKSLFELDYFKNNPIHFFVPFYKENEILKYCFENSISEEVSFDDITDYVTDLPFIDSYKYALFLGLCDGTTKKAGDDEEFKHAYRNILNISFSFFPFHNLISEFYFFFKYYPAQYLDEFIDSQTSIYSTKLKDILLNEFNKFILSADKYLRAKDYKKAIIDFEKARYINPNKENVLFNLGTCYIETKNYIEARRLFETIIAKNENDILAKWKLATCCRLLKEFDIAYDILNTIYNQAPNNFGILIELASLQIDQKKFDKAIIFLLKARDIKIDDINLFYLLAYTYEKNNDYHTALSYHLKIKEIGPKNKFKNIINICQCYEKLEDFKSALLYINKAIDINKSNAYAWMLRGRIYLIGKLDINKAKRDVLKSISIKKVNVFYGNLGHIFLCLGNIDDALINYRKCVIRFRDIEDFTEKFNSDLPYILGYEVPESQYFTIREQMIDYWNKNEKILSEDDNEDDNEDQFS